MRISDRLTQQEKQQLEKLKKEKLSNRDIKELMGINRDRYTRRNGAVRRK